MSIEGKLICSSHLLLYSAYWPALPNAIYLLYNWPRSGSLNPDLKKG